MAISSVLTKDGVFGTYERTRAGIKAYPNTKKVAAPKYLLASPGGPYYYDPDIDGVSPVYNGNSAICGDICTVVACPISHKVYLVSYEFNSESGAIVTFSRLHDSDISVGKYNPRLSMEWKVSHGNYVNVPIQWQFVFKSPRPTIDGISCAPIMAYPDLGEDVFFVWGNNHSYIVDVAKKAVIADINFKDYTGMVQGAHAFKFTPYFPQLIVNGVSSSDNILKIFAVDLNATGIDLGSAVTYYKNTGNAIWSPVINEFNTSVPNTEVLQYPCNYVPASTGWEWETFALEAGSVSWVRRYDYSSMPPVITDYPGNAAIRYRKKYTPLTDLPVFVSTSQAERSGTYSGQYPPYLWTFSKYYTAYTKSAYSVTGPSTIYFNKLDVYDPYFIPCNRQVVYNYFGRGDLDNERTSPPNYPYVPWTFNESSSVPIEELYNSLHSYLELAVGNMPTVGGPQVDVCQTLSPLQPGTVPLVGMYTEDAGYVFLKVNSYGPATSWGGRSMTIKSPFGDGEIIYGMAPLYSPPAVSLSHP